MQETPGGQDGQVVNIRGTRRSRSNHIQSSRETNIHKAVGNEFLDAAPTGRPRARKQGPRPLQQAQPHCQTQM